jgi:hypothetical protein
MFPLENHLMMLSLEVLLYKGCDLPVRVCFQWNDEWPSGDVRCVPPSFPYLHTFHIENKEEKERREGHGLEMLLPVEIYSLRSGIEPQQNSGSLENRRPAEGGKPEELKWQRTKEIRNYGPRFFPWCG